MKIMKYKHDLRKRISENNQQQNNEKEQVKLNGRILGKQ
jgi:hypothetical protein